MRGGDHVRMSRQLRPDREGAYGDQYFSMVDTPSASAHRHGDQSSSRSAFISFNRLPITRMPNVDAPVISVTIAQFGASPAELESKVTKAIEDAVSSVAGAHHITSQITDGISNTTILFRLETNTDRAINDVKDAVTRARAYLPRGIDEPMVQRVDIAGLPILTYAAIAPGKTPEQLVLVRRGRGRAQTARACAAWAVSIASELSSARSGSGSIRSGCRRSV